MKHLAQGCVFGANLRQTMSAVGCWGPGGSEGHGDVIWTDVEIQDPGIGPDASTCSCDENALSALMMRAGGRHAANETCGGGNGSETLNGLLEPWNAAFERMNDRDGKGQTDHDESLTQGAQAVLPCLPCCSSLAVMG